jgi:hypothetical protein
MNDDDDDDAKQKKKTSWTDIVSGQYQPYRLQQLLLLLLKS